MARLKNGILGPLIGKLANVVGYERLGQAVEFIEIYIAFISDDRQNIFDSVYVGRIPV